MLLLLLLDFEHLDFFTLGPLRAPRVLSSLAPSVCLSSGCPSVHVELHYSLYQLCFFLRFCVILNKSFFYKRQLDYKLCCLRDSRCAFDFKIWDQSNFRLWKSWQGVLPLKFSKTPEVSVALKIPWYFSNQITVF